MNITQKRLKEVVIYNSETGIFTCLGRNGKGYSKKNYSYIIGKSRGYVVITIDGKTYRAHHLAWLYIYGELPKEIDHINHDKEDNRISNLRIANGKINGRNKGFSKNNKSGVTGIYWNKEKNKWCAEIKYYYCKIFLGYFDYLDNAIYARKIAEGYYGFHENHGKCIIDSKYWNI